jgi:hypothetical protein
MPKLHSFLLLIRLLQELETFNLQRGILQEKCIGGNDTKPRQGRKTENNEDIKK